MRTVFLLLWATYAYFVPPVSWHGNSRFDLVRAIVEEGRVTIDSFHENTGDKSFRAGHYYSDKAPGVALLGVPAYAIFYLTLTLTEQPLPRASPLPGGTHALVNRSYNRGIYVSTLFSVSLWSALGGAVLFDFLRRRMKDGRGALVIVFAYACSTPVLPYSTMLYGHGVSGAQLFIAFVWLSESRRTALAGLFAGLAVSAEYPAALPFLLLAGLAFLQGGRAMGTRFLLGSLAPLLVLCAYHTLAFGGPLQTGYAFITNPLFLGQKEGLFGIHPPRARALFAILFGRARGLLYISPILAVAAVGTGALLFSARSRRETWFQGLIVLYFIFLNAGYYMWWGGSAFGPRHVIPMLPFLTLGLKPVYESRYRFAIWPLVLLSTLNALGATAIGPESPFRGDQLVDHVWSYLLENRVAVEQGTSNLGIELGLHRLASLLPLLAIWGVGAVAVLSESHASPAREARNS